jgi:UDP-N-acetylmuramoyl-L-alanyl-D-glutamate--2,6-diaminopimelate ligase
MAQMRDAGCRHAVMEVSSHGIDQKRVFGVEFGAAVFTNLSHDHLDYHGTLDDYFEVKTRLFTGENGPAPKIAVVNLDDPYGERLAAKISAEFPAVQLVTYGENPRAQIRAEIFALHTRGAVFRIAWPTGARLVESPLIGRYNVSNVLAAIATAWALGKAPADMLGRLGTFEGVPGRMERVEAGHRFNVVVDYAHTDDALRHALEALRAITPGKLRVVFGCSGHRDTDKRPLMVRAAQESADFVYATSDNPRTESIEHIFEAMHAGVTASQKIAWIEDRRAAIATALGACEAGDCLLIAGKGHETTQQFADTEFPFDDRQVVRELISNLSLQS